MKSEDTIVKQGNRWEWRSEGELVDQIFEHDVLDEPVDGELHVVAFVLLKEDRPTRVQFLQSDQVLQSQYNILHKILQMMANQNHLPQRNLFF